MSFDCFKYLFGFKEIMDDYKKQEAPYTTSTPTPTITTTPTNNTIQTTSSWLETIWNLVKPADKNTNILHRAVELQNTFQCLYNTSALNAINLSHIANSNTQLHSNNQQNVQTRKQQPTYQQHYQTNNTTQNQQPHSRYYNKDNYRPQYQQRNNSNYYTGYNSQNNSPRLRRQNSDIK
jgi:hypothetical protein